MPPMRIAVPDLVTNSYFPALAAEEFGLYANEGLDAHVELLSPATSAMTALRDGEVQLVASGAHTALTAFPGWTGVKLAVAIAQGTPWLLVLRADLPAARGDVRAVNGLRIGAAAGPDAALVHLLAESGVDSARDVRIVRVPGAERPGVSFGVAAAEALESGEIDGFWANALGSETAVRRGAGRVVVDVRRGDGPSAARHYTLAALIVTDALIEREPDRVAAAVRAIVNAQRVLTSTPARAAEVGHRRFPRAAAEMIADLVARDLPFYDPVLHPDSIRTMNRFAQALGLLAGPAAYEQVVAVQFRPLWTDEDGGAQQ
jgi:ABC-type nitrate/sulfonate/bicarbonate transport system substrate-binding protein